MSEIGSVLSKKRKRKWKPPPDYRKIKNIDGKLGASIKRYYPRVKFFRRRLYAIAVFCLLFNKFGLKVGFSLLDGGDTGITVPWVVSISGLNNNIFQASLLFVLSYYFIRHIYFFGIFWIAVNARKNQRGLKEVRDEDPPDINSEMSWENEYDNNKWYYVPLFLYERRNTFLRLLNDILLPNGIPILVGIFALSTFDYKAIWSVL